MSLWQVEFRCQVPVPIAKTRPERRHETPPSRPKPLPHLGPTAPGVGLEPTANGLTVRFRHVSRSGRDNVFRPNPLWPKAFALSPVLSAFHRFAPFRALYAPSASTRSGRSPMDPIGRSHPNDTSAKETRFLRECPSGVGRAYPDRIS
jgi:hypothetical protein